MSLLRRSVSTAHATVDKFATRPSTLQHTYNVHSHRSFSINRSSPGPQQSRVGNCGHSAARRTAHSRLTTILRRTYSTNPHPDSLSQTSQLSVSQRFRKLSREYGWSAMGVYLALSALDFPFCFAAVRWLGPDRVGRAEKAVVEKIKDIIPESIKYHWGQAKAKIKELRPDSSTGSEAGDSNTMVVADIVDEYDHGVVDAEIRSQGANASIWTQLALAYAIHKSFIFIRLPITVAILPKVVKTLRGWGWQIGKRKSKDIQAP